jgi:hypothetical protein
MKFDKRTKTKIETEEDKNKKNTEKIVKFEEEKFYDEPESELIPIELININNLESLGIK